jgi:hypothetical protein
MGCIFVWFLTANLPGTGGRPPVKLRAAVPELSRFTATLVFQRIFTALLGQKKYITLPFIK